MKKRLLSILLTLCMALCIAPASAFAEGGAEGSSAREVGNSSELRAAFRDESCSAIKLSGNIELNGGYLSVSHTVTLDLNGCTLTSDETESEIFQVLDTGNLTIKDSGTDGKIDGQNKNCGFSVLGGILTLDSGSIVNCTIDEGDGGAVDVSADYGETKTYGKFVMNGGAIRNCTAGDDSGAVDLGSGCTFIMNSGTISDCRADDDGGAVFVKDGASFAMNGGTIENCSAGSNGGAVNIRDVGSFVMTGGTIKDCTVDAGGLGDAIYGKDDKAIVAISGGTIENCGASPWSFNAFTVSFDSNGGTPVAEQTVLNSPAIRPNDPTKAGCVFEGWYVGETPFDFSAVVNENTTVVAKWKTLPEVTLNAPDTVCRTQDTIFSFTLPEGCDLITAGYEFEKIGGDLPATFENGQYTVKLSASGYPAEDTAFNVTLVAKTADGFVIRTQKSITIQNEHSEGMATCKSKATCEVCGAEYGELDPMCHARLKHFPAKAATLTAEGNIEYWYCEDCGKYYSDKNGITEIEKASIATAKLKGDSESSHSELPQTGDSSNLAPWIALLLISGGALAGSIVVGKKRRCDR